MKNSFGIACALICTSCAPLSAGQPYFSRATPLCSIVMDEQRYAGQQVVVSALLVHTPHGRELYSPECKRGALLRSSSDTWDRQAKAIVDAALADNQLARVPVVVSGVFQPWTRYENGHPIINVGGPFIDVARVVAARQP